ncbi:MAG TPA: hypothetical protein VFT87_01475 [Candidatus Saccharimonadales bacterium]|nr:hypothetical protein [Candidatus Saccharimonadales bacterium]
MLQVYHDACVEKGGRHAVVGKWLVLATGAFTLLAVTIFTYYTLGTLLRILNTLQKRD